MCHATPQLLCGDGIQDLLEEERSLVWKGAALSDLFQQRVLHLCLSSPCQITCKLLHCTVQVIS